MSRIKPRRRLSDLYAKGREIRFSENGAAVYEEIKDKESGAVERILTTVYDLDGEKIPIMDAEWTDSENDIVLWMRPPNPHQREQALREAQAERSRRVLAARRDVESPERITSEVFVEDMLPETLIEYVLGQDEISRRDEAQRVVLMKDEWKDFADLQDAMRQWDEAGRPDTEEWQPLIERDLEFAKEVDEETDRLREAARESLKLMPHGDLLKKATERRVEMLGNQAFMIRYEREMMLASCRDVTNRDQLYFDSLDDMLTEDEYALDVIANIYSEYITESQEAKNARRAARGSASAEPPAEPETSEASTPTTPTE